MQNGEGDGSWRNSGNNHHELHQQFRCQKKWLVRGLDEKMPLDDTKWCMVGEKTGRNREVKRRIIYWRQSCGKWRGWLWNETNEIEEYNACICVQSRQELRGLKKGWRNYCLWPRVVQRVRWSDVFVGEQQVGVMVKKSTDQNQQRQYLCKESIYSDKSIIVLDPLPRVNTSLIALHMDGREELVSYFSVVTTSLLLLAWAKTASLGLLSCTKSVEVMLVFF